MMRRKLAAIHAATHPGATNERHRSPMPEDEERDEAASELLRTLDQEAAEEAAEAPAGGRAGSKPAPSGATLRSR